MIVNVMIFKDPGCYHIHCLRVIHLYEADYNFILAVKWREMIHQASDQKLLHPGQNGGVPHLNAQNPVFLEEMQNKISRASRKPLVKFDNDATLCYDRILASVACLASRKFGTPKLVTLVMANTLKECKYKLKTMLGVSEKYFSHCHFTPIYGTGQGSGNSPAIWCVISSVLFTSHKHTKPCTKLQINNMLSSWQWLDLLMTVPVKWISLTRMIPHQLQR